MKRFSRNIQLVCLFLVFGAFVCAEKPAPLLHKPAPRFVREDLSGRSIDLNEFRGKVVLLNFWATWCAPCQVELPRFEKWQQNYGARGLQVLAVSMDDHEAPVRRTAGRLHLDFPIMMGDAKLGEEYGGVLGLPVTFLIDREGKIISEFKGATDLNAMEAQLRRVLRNGD